MNKATLGQAEVLTTIHGTQGIFNKGDIVDIRYKFIESGNYLIGIGDKSVYARPEELDLMLN